MKSEQINAYTEIKQRTDRDVRQLGVLVGEKYENTSTADQTVINLSFSIDVNYKDQVWVFIDGQKLIEGASNNYTFTNAVNSISAQITLTAPIVAGLPIQVYKIGAYQEQFPNPSSVTATLLNDVAQPHKMAQDAFQPFVKKTFIAAPNTTIVNRAQVEAASLKAIAGVERVMCRSISQVRDEFGVSGEPVWELDSKESRIRFVGAGWYGASNTAGTFIYTATVSDYCEVLFYGTGLNILSQVDSGARDNRASIDGGAEGANFNVTGSSVLNNRNYGMNCVQPITSGLSLGWHTIKIRNAAVGLSVYGFEILNQRTDLAVLAGTAYNGMKQETLSTLSSSAFNTGITGARGGRVVRYLKDNVISQVVTNVNGAAAYLGSTDHTNEEIVRTIHFREFGANRADDFSTLAGAGSARAFTLDDGTTTLLCTSHNVVAGAYGDYLAATVGNAFFTITFVGTGLDLINGRNALAGSNTVYVDGTLQGDLSGTTSGTADRVKICSGLPYGSHTVKIINVSGNGVSPMTFSIYQPKKPVLPAGAIEVADFNVVADFVANASAVTGTVATGVMRKMATRENTYVGTWAFSGGVDTTSFNCGFNLNTATNGTYAEITFYGTGIEIRDYFAFTQTISHIYSIDGSTNLSSYTTALVTTATGLTFTAATGTVAGTIASGNVNGLIRISGLSLGKHTLKILNNAATNMYVDSIDIITPIHINHSPGMKIGSLSVHDTRAFSPIIDKPEKIDLSKAKAWVSFDSVNQKILGSFGVTAVLKLSTGIYNVYFEKPFKTSDYTSAAASEDTNFTLACFGELEDEGEI